MRGKGGRTYIDDKTAGLIDVLTALAAHGGWRTPGQSGCRGQLRAMVDPALGVLEYAMKRKCCNCD